MSQYKPTPQFRSERGAAALVVAISMLVLMGFAALVVDIGAGFNERAQDQSAADGAAMAGALQLADTEADIVAEVKQYANLNVDATITDADWLACANPTMDSHGPDFTALSDPLGTYPCIAAAGNGYLQVKIPNQEVGTTFGRLLGADSVTTSAFAISQVSPGEGGGILPFGLTSLASNGLVCLRTGPKGISAPPCDAPPYLSDSGNFFIIDSRLFGSKDLGTPTMCGNGQAQERYNFNVAIGLDHFVEIHGSNPLRPDLCSEVLPPNQLYIQKGNGVEPDPGLVSNSTFGTNNTPSRLQQVNKGPSSIPTRTISDGGEDLKLDNKPLWDYLDTTNVSPCDPGVIATGTALEKQAKMDICLQTGSPSFDPSIKFSPRLGQVPQFEEPNWPQTGNGLATIADLQPIFIHGIYFNCNAGGCGIEFFPGEGNSPMKDSPPGKGKKISITQITSFVLPKGSLPAGTFPTNGPGGSLNVSEARLWR